MVVLALRERALDRLRHGVLAIALGAAADRELAIGVAVPHVAAGRWRCSTLAATRFEPGWLPDLLRTLGARTDVALEAFGSRRVTSRDGRRRRVRARPGWRRVPR